jgi:uncharacterized protein YihD (DUF1040 family)
MLKKNKEYQFPKKTNKKKFLQVLPQIKCQKMKSINLIQLKNKTPFKEAKFNKNKKKLKATIVILKRKINSTERE